MNKTFTIAALIAVASAVRLTTSTDALNLKNEDQEDKVEYLPYDEPLIETDEDIKEHKNKKFLAETSQVIVRDCQETFQRLTKQSTIDVAGIIAAAAPWTDPDYTVAQAMLNIPSGSPYIYSWASVASTMTPALGYKLFADDTMASVSSSDVLQGAIGDCYLIAAIASVAKDKAEIFKIFNQQAMNAAGIYSLNLWSPLGIPVTVIVDDKIPQSSSRPLYAKASLEKEIWPILLEKAVSKLFGNYDLIIAGSGVDGMFAITGAPGFSYTNASKTTADLIFADIKTWNTAGHFIQAAVTVSANGLVGNHLYSVLNVVTLPAGSYGLLAAVNLIQVRNPWGATEWTGAYGDTSTFWTTYPAAATAVGMANKNDGSFFISDVDFKTFFYSYSYSVDTTALVRTSWVQLNNADTFGVAGISTYCGDVCKMNTFTIKNTSAATLTYYLVAGNQRARSYGYSHAKGTYYTGADGVTLCNGPFVAGKMSNLTSSAQNNIKVGTTTTIYNDGTVFKQATTIAAGATVTVVWEIDFRRAGMQKDMALTVWASGAGITITQSNGQASGPGYL